MSDFATFEAGYAECYYLMEEQRWPEAADATARFVAHWLNDGSLTAQRKTDVAGVMWMRCLASFEESRIQTGTRGDVAVQLLDELLDWLRRQPDTELRSELARRLPTKVRWLAPSLAAFDTVDELLDVLHEIDDADLIVRVAEPTLREVLWLQKVGSDDARRLESATVLALQRRRPAGGPAETRITSETVLRLERAVSVLRRFIELLTGNPAKRAPEVRAEALVQLAGILGIVGRTDEQKAVAEELIALGAVTVAACDAVLAWLTERGVITSLSITLPLLKAGVFASQGNTQGAEDMLGSLIKEFGRREEPWIRAFLDSARELLADLRDGAGEESG